MDDEFVIEVLCLFCHKPLKENEAVMLNSGDLIKCESCGELNDYDSVINIAKEKGVNEANKQIKKELDNMMNNLFK